MTSHITPSMDGVYAQLASFGWDEQLARDFHSLRAPGTVPARVIAEHRDRYVVRTAQGERAAVLAGRLRHQARTREDLPATGDWVAVDEGDGAAAIHGVLPRRGLFRRKAAGGTTEAQVLAANPFPGSAPNRTLVIFLDVPPPSDTLETLSGQKDEEVRVFLISLKAGGVGLNLTAADYVYIVDPWWNPAIESQAIDRVHRFSKVHCYAFSF